MHSKKNENLNLAEDVDFNFLSSYKLLNITKLHNVSDIFEDFIFELQILLGTISSDLRRLEQRIDSLQKNQALLRKDLVEAGVLKRKI